MGPSSLQGLSEIACTRVSTAAQYLYLLLHDLRTDEMALSLTPISPSNSLLQGLAQQLCSSEAETYGSDSFRAVTSAILKQRRQSSRIEGDVEISYSGVRRGSGSFLTNTVGNGIKGGGRNRSASARITAADSCNSK